MLITRYEPLEDPKDEHLVLSNNQYGLLNYFYKRGVGYEGLKKDEALLLDQRSFGPAVAKGLLSFDGRVFRMTEDGRTFMKNYQTRDPWKEKPSKQFSHYIKIMGVVSRSKLKIVNRATRKSHAA